MFNVVLPCGCVCCVGHVGHVGFVVGVGGGKY